MTFSTYASNGPRNLYAAQRMGVKYVAPTRDVHTKRRLNTLALAATLLVVNVGIIAAVAPSVHSAISGVSFTALSAPKN